jgi:hypothetical protein
VLQNRRLHVAGSSEFFVGSGIARVCPAATKDIGLNDLKQHPEAETVALYWRHLRSLSFSKRGLGDG